MSFSETLLEGAKGWQETSVVFWKIREDNLLTPQQSPTEHDNAQIMLEIGNRIYIFIYGCTDLKFKGLF